MGAPVGDRLPGAPRERKPALAALAVLLILVGALGATVLVVQAGDRVEALKITKRVSAGEHIPKSAVTTVMVAGDDAVNYVAADQVGLLRTKYWASTDLVPGTVLVGEMLRGKSKTPAGTVLVGVSLSAGQFPPQLSVGDTVDVYRVGDDSSGSGAHSGDGQAAQADDVIAAKAKVSKIMRGDDSSLSSDLPVSLRVKEADAAAVTKAASTQDVSLVIVPADS